MRNALRVILTAIAAVMTSSTTGHAASFTELGDLPGGSSGSLASGISADGSVVVGMGTAGGSVFESVGEAFRWSPSEGMVGLGQLPGDGLDSRANGVSVDGSVVVGMGRSVSPTEVTTEPFRWTADTGMVGLGQLPGESGNGGEATGTSADGSVVVGWSAVGPLQAEAFRWTSEGGMVDLGNFTGGVPTVGGVGSIAKGTSADGSVVVGYSITAGGFNEAFRWTADAGMVGLGALPGGSLPSLAAAVSADGSVVVGTGSNPTTGEEAFRWTSDGGMVGLGRLGENLSRALAVSADGAVIVGVLDFGGPADPFIWTEGSGMRNLRNVLANDYGLDLTGWRLSGATGVSSSAAGITIVGNAQNAGGFSEAWLATIPMVPIPEPSTALLFALGLAGCAARCRRMA